MTGLFTKFCEQTGKKRLRRFFECDFLSVLIIRREIIIL